MFYHQNNWCPEADRQTTFELLVGQQNADKLLNGAKQDKLTVLDGYLDVETAKVIGQSQKRQGQANSGNGGFTGDAN